MSGTEKETCGVVANDTGGAPVLSELRGTALAGDVSAGDIPAPG